MLAESVLGVGGGGVEKGTGRLKGAKVSMTGA